MKKESLYFMMIVIALGVLAAVFLRRGNPTDPCKIHQDLYRIEMDSGVVAAKYIDSDNHAMKTIIIRFEGKDYNLLFIPYDNWKDFERLKINDRISKKAYSFKFAVNNEFEFLLTLDCKGE